MLRLRQAVLDQLPNWARPDDPVLRYSLRREQRPPTAMRWLWRLSAALVVSALLAMSLLAYDVHTPLGMSGRDGSALHTVFYFPLLIVQWAVLVIALLSASNAVPNERQRGTWEDLKITSHGAEKMVRAQWAAVFYQMRWALIFLIAMRLIFAGLMLADLTDYQGYRLELSISGITPQVSSEAAVILLAALLTAALLQLPVLIGLNAAVGLVLSTAFRRRGLTSLARLVGFLGMSGGLLLCLSAGQSVLDSTYTYERMSMLARWIGLLLAGVFGDQGLRFMDLQTYLQTWTDVDYGVLLGAALLAVVVVEVVLTNVLLMLAVRLAWRPEPE
ncbi:MAG TPA: hypothetical protein VMT24_12530 [Aggregatilineaceae bacterium]|jgi:hypothetical protein|nr:hypothetical protein [Aggregatilineaceae bacterium]